MKDFNITIQGVSKEELASALSEFNGKYSIKESHGAGGEFTLLLEPMPIFVSGLQAIFFNIISTLIYQRFFTKHSVSITIDGEQYRNLTQEKAEMLSDMYKDDED